MAEKFDYILFDLDGTLTDSKEGIINCVMYSLADAGIEVSDRSELYRFIGPPLVQSFQQFYGFTPEEARVRTAKYRERYGVTGMFENKAFDGMVEALTEIKKAGKSLSVATSKPEIYAVPIAERYGLAPFMDTICGSELNGKRDDKADVIDEVFLRLGITDKSRVLMVGDRKNDVIGAKKCGVACLGVRFGYAEEGELEKAGADYLVDTIEEMKQFILSH